VEGCFRFEYGRSWESITNVWDGSDSDATPIFPPVLLLLGGLCEIFFGMVGLWVGLGHYLFNMKSSLVTTALLVKQLVLGAFTWLIWTIAYPAFNDHRLSGLDNISVPFFNRTEAHSARVFGQIITAMCWCGILQGGQFMFALALSRVQNDTHSDKYNNTSYKLRMSIFTALIFASGLSTFIVGCLFRQHDGAGNYGGSWYYFPNIIGYSELTIISGIILMIFGLLGVVLVHRPTFLQQYYYFAIFTWCWLLFAHNLAQLAQVELPSFPYNFLWEKTGMTSWMICLTTSLVLAPMYLATRLSGNYSAVASS